MAGIEIAEAYVTLLPSMRGMQKRIGAEMGGIADSSSRTFSDRFGAGLRKWSKRGALAVGGAIGGAIAAGLNRSMKIEDAEAKLSGLGHSADDVTRIMDDALKSVKGTAFGLDDAATAAATAVAAGVKPGQDLARYLTLVGDGATIAGVSFSEMGSIFGKVQTQQRAYTMELNMLADRGIPVYQWLQEEYGVTQEELRKMVAAGKVDAETYFRVIEENIGGAALASGDTTRGALRNLGAAYARFGQQLVGAIFPYIKGGLGALTGWIDEAGEHVGPVVDWLAEKVSGFLGTATTGAQGLYDLFVKGDFTGALTRAFGWEEDSGIVDFLLRARDAAKDFGAWVMDTLVPALGDLAASLGGALRDTLDWLVEKFGELAAWYDRNEGTIRSIASTLGEYLADGLRLAGDAVALLVEKGRDLIDWALDNKGLVVALGGAFLGLRGTMLAYDAAQKVVAAGGLVKYLTGMVGKLAIVQTAKKAWAAVTWLVHGAQKALNLVMRMNPIGLLITAIGALVAGFVVLWNTNEGFRNFFINAWQKIKDTLVGVWENYIQPVFAAIGSWVTDTLVPTFTRFWQDTIVPVWDGILGAIQAAWNFIQPIFQSVASFVVDILVAYFRLLAKVAEIVWKTIWAVIKGAWENWIRPVFTALYGWIKDTLIPWFQKLWDKVKSVWDNVSGKVRDAWNAYVKPVFDALYGWIKDTLIPWFGKLWDKVKSVWDNVKGKIKSVWDDTVKPTFNRMKEGVDAVASAFAKARDGIGRAWDKVRQYVAKPIVAVLNFVNDGIIGGINKILDWAGVGKISKITIPQGLLDAAAGKGSPVFGGGGGGGRFSPVALARGGILPGWSPGKDDYFFHGEKFDLALAGGEAIMRPEFTRAVGADWVEHMNALARTGGTSAVKGAFGFARGGIVPGPIGGNPMDWLADRWDDLKGLFRGGMKWVMDRLLGPIDKMLSGNPLYDFAKGAVKKMAGGVKDKLLDLLGLGSTPKMGYSGPGLGRFGPGLPWQAIWTMIKAVAPESRMTSNYRPGARTASGFKSFHGMGRAVDFVSPNMAATYRKIMMLLPWSELYYSRVGFMRRGAMVPRSQVHPATIRNHYDHIHAAYAKGGIFTGLYDKGGYLPPGLSLVANKTGKPEPVLTDAQWDAIKNGGGGGDTYNLFGIPMDATGEVAAAINYETRRTRRGKYARNR